MKLGLLGATFLVLLVLKLTGHIACSWWCVTSPLWSIPALFVVLLVADFVNEWIVRRRRAASINGGKAKAAP